MRALSGCEVASTVLGPVEASAAVADVLNPAAPPSPAMPYGTGRPVPAIDGDEDL